MFKLYTQPANLDNKYWELIDESEDVMELLEIAKTYQKESGNRCKLVNGAGKAMREVEL